MDSKNYTQVLIDGKIYTLGGSEDEGYLQKTASYVNEKNNVLRKIPGFSKQSVEYRTAMVELNLADDYFKALEHSTEVERQRDEMEREMYSLKHELVSTQMKLEVVLKDLEERQRELEELSREKNRLDRKVKSMEKTGNKEPDQAAVTVELEAEVTETEVTEVLTQTAGAGEDDPETEETAEPAGKQEAEETEADTRESNRQLTQKALHAAMAARKKKKH